MWCGQSTGLASGGRDMHGELVSMRARRLTFSSRILHDKRGEVWVINGVKLVAHHIPSFHDVLSLSLQVTPADDPPGRSREVMDLPFCVYPRWRSLPSWMLSKFILNTDDNETEKRICVTARLKRVIQLQCETSWLELIVFPSFQ